MTIQEKAEAFADELLNEISRGTFELPLLPEGGEGDFKRFLDSALWGSILAIAKNRA